MVMGPTGALACSEYGTWSCTDSPCGGGGHGVTGVPTVPPPHAPAQPGPPTTPLRGLRRRLAPGSQQAGGAWGSRPGPAAPLGDRGEAPGPAAPGRPPCTAAITTPGSHRRLVPTLHATGGRHIWPQADGHRPRRHCMACCVACSLSVPQRGNRGTEAEELAQGHTVWLQSPGSRPLHEGTSQGPKCLGQAPASPGPSTAMKRDDPGPHPDHTGPNAPT